MPTRDGYDPAEPLPLVLINRTEPQDIGDAYSGAVTSSRTPKAGILIAAATAAAVIAAFAAGDPVALFAQVTASLVSNSPLQPDTGQSIPTVHSAADAPALVQSTADVQALPPAAEDAPAREVATAEGAGQDLTEKSEPSSEAVFRQFQAWAAERDAQANAGPVEPVQDAPAQVAQEAPAKVVQNAPARVADDDAPTPHRLLPRHRHVLPVHNARAEMRTENFRKKIRRVQRVRAEPQRAQDARAQAQRAQAQPPQNAQSAQAPSSFLPGFGLRN